MIDKYVEAFIIYVAFFSLRLIHLALKTQIVLSLTKKMTILVKYLDFVDIFLKKLTTKLPKYLSINKYTSKLKKSK